jgi:hypothetical protein
MISTMLTQLPILKYADSMSFVHDGKSAQFRLANAEGQYLIILGGVIHLTTSTERFSDNENFLDFVQIDHEYRIITSADLKQVHYPWHQLPSDSPMHIISIFGNVTIQIIFQTVKIEQHQIPVS